jgi:hypothetical protein
MAFKTIARIENGRLVRETETTDKDRARMQEILESRSFPMGMTDDAFLGGVGTLADQFRGDEGQLNAVVNAARAKGYEPNPNDFYCPGLADSVGDPKAFLRHGQARGHVKKVLEERGMEMTTDGNVKTVQREPPKRKRLADDIADAAGQEMVARDPSLAKLSKRELREAAIDKHGAKK